MYTKLEVGVSAFCIPSHTPGVIRPYSVTTYRILVRSPLGRLAKCEVKQRTLPQREWLIELGLALDRVALFPDFIATQDKHKFEYEFNVSWVDDDIFDEQKARSTEKLVELFMSTPTINGRKIFFESLSEEEKSLLIRTYFQIVENNVLAKKNALN